MKERTSLAFMGRLAKAILNWNVGESSIGRSLSGGDSLSTWGKINRRNYCQGKGPVLGVQGNNQSGGGGKKGEGSSPPRNRDLEVCGKRWLNSPGSGEKSRRERGREDRPFAQSCRNPTGGGGMVERWFHKN